jgi:hypothetical protein
MVKEATMARGTTQGRFNCEHVLWQQSREIMILFPILLDCSSRVYEQTHSKTEYMPSERRRDASVSFLTGGIGTLRVQRGVGQADLLVDLSQEPVCISKCECRGSLRSSGEARK